MFSLRKQFVFVNIFVISLVFVDCSWQTGGEFVAGTFILTQKSLDEAPYRYAGVLREVLDKIEGKDPPRKSDEENCSARYRIEPSGKFISDSFLHMGMGVGVIRLTSPPILKVLPKYMYSWNPIPPLPIPTHSQKM